MEKDEMGMDYLTEGLIGKWPIWQEDQVVNGQIGKGPNARGRNGKGRNGRGRGGMIPFGHLQARQNFQSLVN